MAPAISVEGLGKQYRLGAIGASSLREDVERWFRPKEQARLIWAIRDVSFDVAEGEAVAIIGRNGAGKSTLLKILSRVTSPTSGRAQLRGRVASLLEVGTGFHPELTGRENIFLNGSILGLSKAEIRGRFDQIVAFSEIEEFIDTPVKRYSSGMYVRLAFAVAAHLEPEILIVDEVLAVGDMKFQKKCLGTMGNVAREGRTVLFVSHNMSAVSVLCSRALLLRQGRLSRDGDAAQVVSEYLLEGDAAAGERVWADVRDAPGTDRLRLRAVRVLQAGRVAADVEIDDDVMIQVEFLNFKPGARITTSVHLLERFGSPVFCSVNYPEPGLPADEWFDRPYPGGLFRTTCVIPGGLLNEGRYGISAFVRTEVSNQEAVALETIWFTAHDTNPAHSEFSGWGGVVRPRLAWRTEFLGGQPTSPESSSRLPTERSENCV